MRAVAFITGFALWLGTTAVGVPWHAEADGPQHGVCYDPGPSFNPLGQLAGCMELEKHNDAMLLVGLAILDDDYAPSGTEVTAMVDGTECGRTTISSARFKFYVLGDGERAGCAEPGDAVELVVGGRVATPRPVWQVITGGHAVYYSVRAIEEHAWFWFERRGQPEPAAGTLVEAYLDDLQCGEAEVERAIVDMVGFRRLIVPSSDLQPGCGAAGATVSFSVGGARSISTYEWQPRVQRIEIALYGDASCDLAVNAIDAALSLQWTAGLAAELPCDDAPDVNGDGQTTAIDAALILQYGAGLIEGLPV